jgi:hypothetical protein
MKKYLLILLTAYLFSGCTDEINIDQFDGNKNRGNISGDTVYVQLSPSWEGFNNPKAILIGKEPFVYIADTDNDRIVMMNLAGEVLGTKTIRRPIALAQDYKLNLIVCAQFDTVVAGVSNSFSAVYKINLFAAGHDLQNAEMTRLLPRARTADFNFPQRKYKAVAAFYNNSFYVARSGPNNESVYDPDNSILMFEPKPGGGDSLIGRVPNIDPLSSGLLSGNGINSMATFNRRNLDFVVTYEGNVSFKSQWFHYYISPAEEKYVSQFDPRDQVKYMDPGRFLNPTGSWVDAAGNIYIADAGKDSIYKFNAYGEELQSFGGENIFNKAYAVAFFDRTLYVVDAGANKILRFILSTDLQ